MSDGSQAAATPERDLAPLSQPPIRRASLEEVFREHHTYVWRSLRRLGLSEAEVDDAVQDVFLVVHERLPEFEFRASLRTWLFRIAMNVAMSHRRRHARAEYSSRAAHA